MGEKLAEKWWLRNKWQVEEYQQNQCLVLIHLFLLFCTVHILSVLWKASHMQKERENHFREVFQVKFNALFDLPILSTVLIDFPSPS